MQVPQGSGLLCLAVLSSLTLAGCSEQSAFRAPTQIAEYQLNQRPSYEKPPTSPQDQSDASPTAQPPPQAQGFYSNGSLTHSDKLPWDGPGFMKIFRFRDRGWSTLDLQMVIGAASAKLSQAFLGGERVQIGDMSDFNGGQLSLHASHQNGLDADIAYLRNNHREIDPNHNGFDEVFVQGQKVTGNFDIARNWYFINALVATKRLGRVFVDPVIKATFCSYAKKIGIDTEKSEALHRLRPLDLHQDHMHVRITCPTTSNHCVAQADPAPGSGCHEVAGGRILKYSPEDLEFGE